MSVGSELIARSMARIMETPAVGLKEVRSLGAAEVRLLLKTAHSHNLCALGFLLVTSGEALALTWSDVDLGNGRPPC